MTCTLTIVFSTPGYGSGTVTSDFEVPNGSYFQPYIKSRPDLTSSYCPGHPGYELLCPGNQGEISFYAVATCTDVGIISSNNSCPRPEVAKNYDCINGTCIESTQYKTPGLYKSLGDCQAVCANGGACSSGKQCVDPTTFCPDGKVCIDQGEFASIEALISKIGSEVC